MHGASASALFYQFFFQENNSNETLRPPAAQNRKAAKSKHIPKGQIMPFINQIET
jgi:hypothetical protein